MSDDMSDDEKLKRASDIFFSLQSISRAALAAADTIRRVWTQIPRLKVVESDLRRAEESVIDLERRVRALEEEVTPSPEKRRAR